MFFKTQQYCRIKLLFVFISITLFSCTQIQEKKTENIETESSVMSKTIVGEIDGKIFSVPSPYEFLPFIKSLNSTYNLELLNPTKNTKQYNSDFKKCLNFGVYGIDIAYISAYENTSTALQYYIALKNLSKSLELQQFFSTSKSERIMQNIENQDSIIYILSYSYREIDKYLKTEKQKKEAALIITGGWIESLFLLTQIHIEKPSHKTLQKIAEHKYYAENMLALLREYYNSSAEHKKLIDAIVNICYHFDGISVAYKYSEPITNIEEKHTTLTSTTTLSMPETHLTLITNLVKELRTNIISIL